MACSAVAMLIRTIAELAAIQPEATTQSGYVLDFVGLFAH